VDAPSNQPKVAGVFPQRNVGLGSKYLSLTQSLLEADGFLYPEGKPSQPPMASAGQGLSRLLHIIFGTNMKIQALAGWTFSKKKS